MKVERSSLADRAEAILRKDRLARQQPGQQGILLALTPDDGAIADLMDGQIHAIAARAGLEYLRPDVADLLELPEQVRGRTLLVVADLTGRDEHVITRVYQAVALGLRVLLSAQAESDVPPELGAHLPKVCYSLQQRWLDDLLREVLDRAISAVDGLSS